MAVPPRPVLVTGDTLVHLVGTPHASPAGAAPRTRDGALRLGLVTCAT
jgi:hypothetical protein